MYTKRTYKLAVLLFLVSLVLRSMFLYVAVQSGITPYLDEKDYFNRALNYREAIIGIATGNLPGRDLVLRAYGGGKWPPLHSLLLAAGTFLPMGFETGARYICVIISALTTAVIFLCARSFLSDRFACISGLVHMLHPSFLSFSHYLWSESTFLFFYALIILFFLRMRHSLGKRAGVIAALFSGAMTGLAALSRASILVSMPVVAFLFCFESIAGRFNRIKAAAFFIAFLAVITPWLMILYHLEGRVILVSNTAGLNLYLGNNPWIPDGIGSSWQFQPGMSEILNSMGQYAARNGIDMDQAAGALAMIEIKSDPLQAIFRVVQRSQMILCLDYFLIRHCLHLQYGPMDLTVCRFIMIYSIGFQILTLFMGLNGLIATVDRKIRMLFIALILANFISPLITFAMPRLLMPVLLIFTILSGNMFHSGNSRPIHVRFLPGMLLALLSVWISFHHANFILKYYIRPSIYYQPILKPCLDSGLIYSDSILLNTSAKATPIELELLIPGSYFSQSGQGHIKLYQPIRGPLDICSSGDADQIALAAVSQQGDSLMLSGLSIRHGWNRELLSESGSFSITWTSPGKLGTCY